MQKTSRKFCLGKIGQMLLSNKIYRALPSLIIYWEQTFKEILLYLLSLHYDLFLHLLLFSISFCELIDCFIYSLIKTWPIFIWKPMTIYFWVKDHSTLSIYRSCCHIEVHCAFKAACFFRILAQLSAKLAVKFGVKPLIDSLSPIEIASSAAVLHNDEVSTAIHVLIGGEIIFFLLLLRMLPTHLFKYSIILFYY